MSDATIREHVIVIDDHIVHLTIDQANRPESISVEVNLDWRRLRGWEEPGWRDVSFGAAAGLFYWWSARRMVALTLDPAAVVAEIAYDEDIVLAFPLGAAGWLVVGETSVTIVRAGIPISRLDFGEVIAVCCRHGDSLDVVTSEGSSFVVVLDPDGLRLQT